MGDLSNLPNSRTNGINDECQSWTEVLKDYVGLELDSKRNWYSSVAKAYDRVRPRYSQEIISRIITISQLPRYAQMLEIGCGPAIATISFADRGFSLVSLEPNLEASQIAQRHCISYSQVKIINTSFEEWDLVREEYDAILAATSWHWIDPEIAYLKAWQALKAKGSLILLWNTPPQINAEIYQLVAEIYCNFAPEVPLYARYEDRDSHQRHFQKFSQDIVNSGYFQDLGYESRICEARYSLDDYLLLLSTLSPYIALEETVRCNLFVKLREVLEHYLKQNGSDRLNLYYLSAFHIARKIDRTV
jgi:SAM-dependent methyltransferase